MKIALCSSYVPFIKGGARNIVEWLELMLQEQGHHVERIYLPQVDTPDLLFQQMFALRWIDLSMADRIICFRPQAHLIPHSHKILWFIHHIRSFYDLWHTPYRGFQDDYKISGFRDALHHVDDVGLREAKSIFTNSRVVAERLKTYNRIESEVLYPPILHPERFHSAGFNDEIVCICRLEHHKRQHLLIEALRSTKTPVNLSLFGVSSSSEYLHSLVDLISELGLTSRVRLDNQWISEEEKVSRLSSCLAAAYLPVNEDSYGYPCLEASHSAKPILTTTDSGGVLELVDDGVNGYVVEPTPLALADAMDRLYLDRARTVAMGTQASEKISAMRISWPHVMQRLLQ